MSDPAERTRDAVVAAARTLFARFGHAKTSVEEIAREAGLSKATVYNYFQSKERIVAGVMECERKILVARLRRAVDDAADPLDALRGFFRTRVREVQRLHNAYRAEREDYLHYMPHVARTIEELRKEERQVLEEVLEKGADQGFFRSLEDIPLTADILFTTALSLTFPLFGRPVRSAGKRVERFIDIFLAGICSDHQRRRLLTKEAP